MLCEEPQLVPCSVTLGFATSFQLTDSTAFPAEPQGPGYSDGSWRIQGRNSPYTDTATELVKRQDPASIHSLFNRAFAEKQRRSAIDIPRFELQGCWYSRRLLAVQNENPKIFQSAMPLGLLAERMHCGLLKHLFTKLSSGFTN